MHAAEFILYVDDQSRARAFYRHVLDADPTLDVPGMTEFDVGGATLGLMPGTDLETLLAGQVSTGRGQRCEVYLRRADAAAMLARAAESGGTVLEAIRERSWGERVGYVLDPDGHVLALAVPAAESDGTQALRPVGWVRSPLTEPGLASRQPDEGAPSARIEIAPQYRAALAGLDAGGAALILTWLHRADRQVLTVHPRGDPTRPEVGVFATRSPSRPNPIGLHRVRIARVTPEGHLELEALEAIDGTPVLDIKPVLGPRTRGS